MIGRLIGFLRLPIQWEEELNVCISHANATLKIGDVLLSNFSAEHKVCRPQQWPDDQTSTRVFINFEARKIVSLGAYNAHQQIGTMQLQHKEPESQQPKVMSRVTLTLFFLFTQDYDEVTLEFTGKYFYSFNYLLYFFIK